MKVNNAWAGAAPVSQATSLVSDEWRRTIAQACQPEQAEELAGYGRWWLSATSRRLVLSVAAADYLGVSPGLHAGRVWLTGHAQWVDGAGPDRDFLRREIAMDSGLQSGYIFLVTYRTPDGEVHRPGVLEFFSKLPRQREAQLPDLARSISALIAQTAQRMVQQEHVRRFALCDEMTGLANRIHFHALLDQACLSTPATGSFAVLYIDLDHFKPVNDAFGHEAGNVVLCEFARRLGMAPRHLCLELTEGVLMSRMEKSIPIMRELQRLGFEISLDDFGTGHSSLSMLKNLPISSLKIDRLFMQGVPHQRDDCAIVRAMLELGRNMHLRVIAEGVESDAQLGFLRQFGHAAIQGYLLGRPMSAARLIELHGRQGTAPAPHDATHS